MQKNVVRTMTFKESKDGPKCDKATAIDNSDNWFESDAPENLDDIPSLDDDHGSSSASASTA